MSFVQEIIAAHGQRDSVAPGEIVTVDVDRVYMQDGNIPTVARLFEKHGFTKVFDPQRVGAFFDHSVLAANGAISNRLRDSQRFAREHGLRTFPLGSGISHVVALEEGWFEPGTIVLGADSHTCTGGVVQCLALGMGASDVTAALVTGKTWLRVPETTWLTLHGTPGPGASSKDVMLFLLSKFGQNPFLYRSVEFTGDWMGSLSTDSAATIANMGVEMGAKCVFLPPGPGREQLRPIEVAGHELTADIDGLPPFVALPHSPLGAVELGECAGQEIDYVFVGSCANSRLEDLRELAAVLAENPVHDDVHCVVTPGSREVMLSALSEGLIETITRAGAVVAPPGCGACVGTQGTVPASGDRVLSTMNRNFKGRMGNSEAQIWLSSPLVAATTAVLGRIPKPEELPC